MRIFVQLMTLALLFSAKAQASKLVVCDIDDTIKVSHVKNIISKYSNAFSTSHAFFGMNDLLNSLANKNYEIKYVSAAPKNMMTSSHSNFLMQNGFPAGDLILAGKDKANHKVVAIEKLIADNSPTEMILIGDNGEKDAGIYRYFVSKYPEIKFHTFIHQLYSKKSQDEPGSVLLRDQIGYVTPVEIYTELEKAEVFSKDEVNSALIKLIGKIDYEDLVGDGTDVSFAEFQDCSDFKMNSWLHVEDDLHRAMALKIYSRKIQSHCAEKARVADRPMMLPMTF